MQYTSTIGDYIYNYVSAPEDKASGKREPSKNLIQKITTPRKTWNSLRIYESQYYYLQTPYGVLIVPYADQTDQAIAREKENQSPKDILSFIDYEK